MCAGRWELDTAVLGSTLAAAFAGKPTPNPFDPSASNGPTPEERTAISDRAWREMRAYFRNNAKRTGKAKPKAKE